MAEGWIKLHRGFTDWGWYQDANTKAVFLHLLLSATHTKTEYQGWRLRPGDVVFGQNAYAKHLGLTRQSVRTAINHLKSTSEITIKTGNKFSIISITKWSEYQGINQPANHQSTSNQPATNHIQEGKEGKEVRRHLENEVPLEDDLPDWDKVLYQRGKAILGIKAGGVITQLKNTRSVGDAIQVIEAAAGKENPMEYVQGVLKKKKGSRTPLGVGG